MTHSRVKLAALAVATLLGPFPIEAGIIGLAIPATVAPGASFPLVIASQDQVEQTRDISLALGFIPGPTTDQQSELGTLIGTLHLADNQTDLTNVSLTLPTNAPLGPATFTSCLTSLKGAQSEPTLTSFDFKFTIGN